MNPVYFAKDAEKVKPHKASAAADKNVSRCWGQTSYHLFIKGLIRGVGSDVVVHCPQWNASYRLHRLVLSQSPYFEHMLVGHFSEARDVEISVQFDDPYIQQEAFDLVLARLYGGYDAQLRSMRVVVGWDVRFRGLEEPVLLPLLATASYMELPDLVQQCINDLLQYLSPENAFRYMRFADSHMMPGSKRILDACFTVLCRESWANEPLKAGLWNCKLEWVERLVGSDAFWVSTEYHRYQFAMDIIRQRQALYPVRAATGDIARASDATESHKETQISDTDGNSSADGVESADFCHLTPPDELHYWGDSEEAYTRILSECIHYMHMTFWQLLEIQADIEKSNRSLLPVNIIRNALWQQMELRHRIETAKEDQAELGLTKRLKLPCDCHVPSSTLKQTIRYGTTDKLSPFLYLIPSDDTTHIGESVLGFAEELHELCEDVLAYAHTRGTSTDSSGTEHERERQPGEVLRTTNVSSYPDIETYSKRLADQPEESPPLESDGSNIEEELDSSSPDNHDEKDDIYENCSTFAPFRFSVEFFGVAQLKEKVRVYSMTFFYGGSFWNTYIQKVKTTRKGTQLGVYLHRQAVPRGVDSDQGMTDVRILKPYRYDENMETLIWKMDNMSMDANDHRSYSLSRYVDRRKMTKTWFKIFCPSNGPSHTMTMFQSSPDLFAVMQSWGWRSTSLCSDDYLLATFIPGLDSGERKESSLRFSIVMAHV